MKIFSGTSNKPLAEKIANVLEMQLSSIEMFVFPDGEKRIQIQERVVDEQCIVVQSTSTPVAENYMELFFIVDALKRSGAREVIVVMPYVGYQRQDHVFRDGEAVSLEVVIRMLEVLKVGKVITFDLHSIKIPEVFSIPIVHLSALPLFAETIKAFNSLAGEQVSSSFKNAILVSPDMGGLRRIEKMSELLDGMDWIATVKDRDLETGEIVINKIEGDVTKLKKRVFLVDDMIASGKTIAESAKLLKQHGAEEIFVFATHAVFTKEAPLLLQESVVEKVFVTDSVFVPEEKKFEKLEILSIAENIAKELQEQ